VDTRFSGIPGGIIFRYPNSRWPIFDGIRARSTASGSNSAAFSGATAGGVNSFAVGVASTAGICATAIGFAAVATGGYSTAIGQNADATNNGSIAIGTGTNASGSNAMATGSSTTASGGYSTAIGSSTTASAFYSTSAGYSTIANSYDAFVAGQYNTGLSSSGATPNAGTWVATDPLLEVGNGTGSSAKSDALVVYKNGNAAFQGVVTVAAGGDIPMYTGN
jgi:hypothetical protein